MSEDVDPKTRKHRKKSPLFQLTSPSIFEPETLQDIQSDIYANTAAIFCNKLGINIVEMSMDVDPKTRKHRRKSPLLQLTSPLIFEPETLRDIDRTYIQILLQYCAINWAAI